MAIKYFSDIDIAGSLTFTQSSAAFINHNVTSQSVKFRLSNSSALDVTPFEITPGYMSSTVDMYFGDNDKIRLGASSDLQLYHDGSNSFITTVGTGDLILEQKTDNKDIIFKSDDGAGSIAEYFRLDGSQADGTYLYTLFPDNSNLVFGTGGDLTLSHSGTVSDLTNWTGDLRFIQNANDKDISFQTDDGSGGVTEYFRVDGAYEVNRFLKNARFNDSVKANFGTGDDLQIYHDATNTHIANTNGDLNITTATGDMYIVNNANDKDIIFQSDNGSGGVENYIQIDGSEGRTLFNKHLRVNDSVELQVGAAADLKILHDSNHSYLKNYTGDLYIENFADDKDIIFKSDDGSGGVATYFSLDGGLGYMVASKQLRFLDSVSAYFGSDNDMSILHDGSDGYITNGEGSLIIKNNTDNADIILKSDDGSGGTTAYLTLDGSAETTIFSKPLRVSDSVAIEVGSGADLQLSHNGTNSAIINYVGDLNITNGTDDGDITFNSDNGSGGTTEYFRLDGGDARMYASREIRFVDGVASKYGNSGDLGIYHDGSDSYIEHNGTGDLKIYNGTNDGDVLLRCDDGSGGVATYLQLDGTNVRTLVKKNLNAEDNVQLQIGNSQDLKLYHSSSHSYISQEGTGNLFIQTLTDDGDIIFMSDDGSGSIETYFFLDGSANGASPLTVFPDHSQLGFGSGPAAYVYHNGSDFYLDNYTGDFYITAQANDKDLILRSDDGSGGVTPYLTLDGSLAQMWADKDLQFSDSIKAKFGASSDLQIYHDGSNSYIVDAGTGDLLNYFSNDWKVIKYGSGEVSIWATSDAGVKLFYDNSLKLETTSDGVEAAGNVTLNGDGRLLKFTPSSYDDVELGIDSNGFVIYNTTDARYDLKINGDGNATFGGNADVAGNVEARGYLQAFSTFYMRGTTQVMNKAADGFLSFLARDTSGSETVMNISNVGTLTTAGKIQTAGEVEGGSLDINGNADIAGNLTISGTTALDVTANINDNWAGRFENTNSGGYGILAKIAGTSSNELVFEARVGSSTKMAVTGDGNVGIGTTSPEAMLTVKSDATNTNQPVRITNSVTDTHTGLFLNNTGNTVGEKYGMQFGGYNEYSIGGIFGVMDSGSGSTSGDITIDFANGTSAGALVEKVRFTHEGNVGIGTTSPTELLHIKNPSNSWNQYAVIRMGTETSDSYASEIGFHRGTSSDADRGLFLSGDGTNKHVRVLHDGKVGIGTTTPLTNLQVNSATDANSTIAYSENNTLKWYTRHKASDDSFEIVDVPNTTTALKIESGSNATFAGTISSGQVTATVNSGTNFEARKGNGSGAVGFGGTTHQTGLIEGVDGGGIKLYTAGNDVNWGGAWALNTTWSGTGMTVAGDITVGDDVFIADSGVLNFGSDNDFFLFHDGADAVIRNNTGHVYFDNLAQDKDIYIRGNDGGSTITALTLDMSDFGSAYFSHDVRVYDGGQILIGTGSDLSLTHDASNSYISNSTGDLYIQNDANDKDIIFRCDDGSNGLTAYLTLDGSAGHTTVQKDMYFGTGVNAYFAGASGARVVHDGSNANWINGTGELRISNGAVDADIVFKGNDGGSNITALTLDMSAGGNATFAGSVSAVGLSLSSATGPIITLTDTDASIGVDSIIGHIAFVGTEIGSETSRIASVSETAGGEAGLRFYTGASVTQALQLDKDQNATFAGSITTNLSSEGTYFTGGSGGLRQLSITSGTNTSAHALHTFNIASSNGKYEFDVNGTTELSLDSSSATFAGNVAIGANSPTSLSSNTTSLSIDSTRTDLSGAVFFKANGTVQSQIYWGTSGLVLEQLSDDADMIFKSDDGSGGTTAYLTLDGSAGRTIANLHLQMADGKALYVGDGLDAGFYHSSGHNYIENNTGNLTFVQNTDDGDIIFQSDDGSGGTATYLTLDGSAGYTTVQKEIRLEDSVKLRLGNGGDTQMYHDGSNTTFYHGGTGNLIFMQGTDDADIVFSSDDGAGGNATYFYLDGSVGFNRFPYPVIVEDSVNFNLGTGQDFQLLHNGSDSVMRNATGDLYIQQNTNDGDIIFQSDDGSGGITAYLTLDGGAGYTTVQKQMAFADDVKATFGSGNDLQLYHDGTNSYVRNTAAGHIYIQNRVDDKDIIFQSDDGSGGVTDYIRLDGSIAKTTVSRPLKFNDNISAEYGTDTDMIMYHSGSNGAIENYTGNLTITNNTDDKDIIFQSDDGVGGVKEYFRLDGSAATSSGITTTLFPDNSKLKLGAGGDFVFFHDGTDSTITNNTGDVIIQNAANDKDIMLKSDNGSGGTTSYITLDGSNVSVNILTQKVIMANLPTSDPSVDGQLWNSNGTLKVSAGE